ncbi:DUF6731 family protein [Candidatus Rariloculus sp.]|uniref:DUF6731 family protein n=1 Tax=Candidatus Rariloculus sp. TaxID=3101265 RepID=UPI003D0C87A9
MPETFRANIFSLEEFGADGVIAPLHQAMRGAWGQPTPERTRHVGAGNRRLEGFEEDPPLYLANFVTLRFLGPGRGSPTQVITGMGLRDHESYAYQTAMLYDSERSLAFIESGRPGMGAGAVATYLGKFAVPATSYQFTPCLDAEAHRRAMRMQNIRKLQVRVAAGRARRADRDEGLGLIAAFTEEFDANFMDMELAIGRERRRFLSAGRVREFLASLLREADEPDRVLKVRITGSRHEDDPTEMIDLLQHRESRERQLDVDPVERNIPCGARWDALRDIWRQFILEHG